MQRILVLLALSLSFAPSAFAQEREFYMGGLLGSFEYDDGGGEGSIAGNVYSYRLIGGYRFNQHFGLEFGLGRTGELEGSLTDTVSGIGDVTFELDATVDLYQLVAVGFLPLNRLDLFGGVGYYSASIGGPITAVGFGEVGGTSWHERGSMAVLGLQRDFRLDLRNLSIRGQYEWFDFSDGVDASSLSVGMILRF